MKAIEGVAARVAEIQARGAERAEITVERIARELAKIGFADIRKAVRWHSSLITEEDNPDGGDVLVIKNIVTNNVEIIGSDEIDDETAAAIAEISQNEKGGIKIKLHDKRAALVDLGRHLNMFEADNTRTLKIDIAQRIQEGLERRRLLLLEGKRENGEG